MTKGKELAIPPEILEIATTLERAGYETWCVGGAIRDALLGQSGGDFDLATSATPDEVQRLFRHTVAVGLRFGTVGVLDRWRNLHEVTTFRRDVATDGRHAVVEYGVSLDEDLARRDFTINAMAYHPLREEWRDPFDGAADLDRGLIRAVGDGRERFREDYLRILRAIRFAARLEFTIDPETWAAARASAAGLERLSPERVRDEWVRSLETARSLPRLIELWHDGGASPVLLPELVRESPLAGPAVGARDPVLLTALLCRDAVTVAERLRFSNAEIARIRRVVEGPPAPADDSPVAVRRWLSRVGVAADDLLTAHRLRHGEGPSWGRVVDDVRARRDPVRRGDLAVTGDDLLALGIARGPEMGRLLEELLEIVLDDPSANDREALLALARSREPRS